MRQEEQRECKAVPGEKEECSGAAGPVEEQDKRAVTKEQATGIIKQNPEKHRQ